jgi:threonylcarbamoyladenosine tRNA methylthiotransferase MtaB
MSNAIENTKTVAFYTLGCKLNFSETSTISRLFEQKGYRKVNFEEGADIYIINTCSVTENADKKCKKVVSEAKKLNPDSFVSIIGCYAQLKPQEIATIPGVDAVLGAAEKFRMFDFIPNFEKKEKAQVFNSPIRNASAFTSSYSVNDRTRTFLKVQDGCDYSCSFCTIPLARGSSRSDSISSVVAQAKEIASKGVKEIVLTGVNIGDFGLQDGRRVNTFLDLVKELDDVEGIERFRISSIEPNLLNIEIINLVGNSKRFVPHFHIPLQSGNNKQLAAMRRRYKRELYAERVEAIKSVMPNACIGVDVIVGFPGETDEDFKATYEFINNLDISYLHVFTYSERANTHALNITPVVPGNIRADRSKMLHTLSDKKRRAFYETQLGTTHTVLWENDIEEGQMHGFTENYVRVAAQYDPALINETSLVTLTDFNDRGTVNCTLAEEILNH